jgi:hypothetical protein
MYPLPARRGQEVTAAGSKGGARSCASRRQITSGDAGGAARVTAVAENSLAAGLERLPTHATAPTIFGRPGTSPAAGSLAGPGTGRARRGPGGDALVARSFDDPRTSVALAQPHDARRDGSGRGRQAEPVWSRPSIPTRAYRCRRRPRPRLAHADCVLVWTRSGHADRASAGAGRSAARINSGPATAMMRT